MVLRAVSAQVGACGLCFRTTFRPEDYAGQRASVRAGQETFRCTLPDHVTDTLDLALQPFGLDDASPERRPRLLSDNGPSYIAGDLSD